VGISGKVCSWQEKCSYLAVTHLTHRLSFITDLTHQSQMVKDQRRTKVEDAKIHGELQCQQRWRGKWWWWWWQQYKEEEEEDENEEEEEKEEGKERRTRRKRRRGRRGGRGGKG
jgi:hypothetical protein